MTQMIFRYFSTSKGCIHCITLSISHDLQFRKDKLAIKKNCTLKGQSYNISLFSFFSDGMIVADGSHLWNNLQDMLQGCTLHLVRGVSFTVGGKDAREASVGLMRGKIPSNILIRTCEKNRFCILNEHSYLPFAGTRC